MSNKTMVVTKDYQKIFHWAETQKDGEIASFKTCKNDPFIHCKFSPYPQQRLPIDALA